MRALARFTLVALVLIGCLGCDQISKTVARQTLPGTGIHSYLGDTFRLQYAQNAGAFLSLGDSLPAALRYDGLVVGVGAIIVALLAWALLSPRLTAAQRIALAAIAAGGASNLLDRLQYGGVVTDFLNLGLGTLRTGIFNVADVMVMVGVIALFSLWRLRPPRQDPG